MALKAIHGFNHHVAYVRSSTKKSGFYTPSLPIPNPSRGMCALSCSSQRKVSPSSISLPTEGCPRIMSWNTTAPANRSSSTAETASSLPVSVTARPATLTSWISLSTRRWQLLLRPSLLSNRTILNSPYQTLSLCCTTVMWQKDFLTCRVFDLASL